MTERFRRQLKSYLRVQGISGAELSRRTGIPKQTISDWLSGTRPRNMELVKRIADELGIPVATLAFGNGATVAPAPAPSREVPPTPARRKTLSKLISEFRDGTRQAAHGGEKPSKSISRVESFLLHHARELVQIRGLAGFPAEISESWERVLGWPMRELRQMSWLELIHPSDRSITLSAIEDFVLHGTESSKCYHRLLHKSGRYSRFETRFTVDFENALIYTISWPAK